VTEQSRCKDYATTLSQKKQKELLLVAVTKAFQSSSLQVSKQFQTLAIAQTACRSLLLWFLPIMTATLLSTWPQSLLFSAIFNEQKDNEYQWNDDASCKAPLKTNRVALIREADH
jgi:hypothetical protein